MRSSSTALAENLQAQKSGHQYAPSHSGGHKKEWEDRQSKDSEIWWNLLIFTINYATICFVVCGCHGYSTISNEWTTWRLKVTTDCEISDTLLVPCELCELCDMDLINLSVTKFDECGLYNENTFWSVGYNTGQSTKIKHHSHLWL